MRPHIEFYNWSGWRATLEPTDWTEWFDSYERFIAHYADIAQEFGVELYAVGSELWNSSGHESEWREIIASARDLYSGPLTYYDGQIAYGRSRVEFWDALDYVGVDSYSAITGNGPGWETGVPVQVDPPFEQFGESLAYVLDDVIYPVLVETGIPVLITESGRPSVDRVDFYAPGTWQFPDLAPDFLDQAMWIESILQLIAEREWLIGFFSFSWDLKSDSGYIRDDWPLSFSPRYKPAEQAIRVWFAD